MEAKNGPFWTVFLSQWQRSGNNTSAGEPRRHLHRMGVTEWCWTDYPEPQPARDTGWLEVAGWINVLGHHEAINGTTWD